MKAPVLVGGGGSTDPGPGRSQAAMLSRASPRGAGRSVVRRCSPAPAAAAVASSLPMSAVSPPQQHGDARWRRAARGGLPGVRLVGRGETRTGKGGQHLARSIISELLSERTVLHVPVSKLLRPRHYFGAERARLRVTTQVLWAVCLSALFAPLSVYHAARTPGLESGDYFGHPADRRQYTARC